MDEPLEKNFVEQMRDELRMQLSEFELAQKQERHNAKIVAGDGLKKWGELKDCLKNYVGEINEGLPDAMLSYSESSAGNELRLRHELSGRDIQIIFDPASAVISYQGNNGKGAFRPHVEVDALEYGWKNATPSGVAKPGRKFRMEDDEPPMTFSTSRMSEIIISCVVLEPVPE
jgi:hypothetical protein